jgi:HupE / UreJ protein
MANPIRSATALAFVLTLALVFGRPSVANAHEIPATVTILSFVKPQGNRLTLLVRAPLEAIRDAKWPLRGPGYLEVGRLDDLLHDAAKIWIADCVRLYENDVPLPAPRIVAARVSLPSDRSFESYDRAAAHVMAAPLAESTELAWQQAMMDVLLEYPIASDRSRFSVEPTLARLGVHTTTVLRFLPASGGERAFEYPGDPGLVRLDPRWHQATLQFGRLGFLHILDGLDHLLFVLCLVIPFRKIRPLVGIVSAFTVGHSITLVTSILGLAPSTLWFPPLIEVLIAASIVYMAFENIVSPKLERRWLIAFGFGLVHGFGFAFALRESLQFAGSHLAASLFSFNVGVELGQLLVLAIAVPALAFLFRRVVPERMGTVLLSALIAHTAWHWMLDRGALLRRYSFEWPALDSTFAAGAMRALMLGLVVAAVGWAMYELFGRFMRGAAIAAPAPAAVPADADHA